MALPVDDGILVSVVNTYLRDGGSFEDFCAGYDVAAEEVILRLQSAGYAYDESARAFKRI